MLSGDFATRSSKLFLPAGRLGGYLLGVVALTTPEVLSRHPASQTGDYSTPRNPLTALSTLRQDCSLN